MSNMAFFIHCALSAHLNGLECVVCRYVKYAIIDLNHVRAGVGDDWTVLYIVGI